MSRLRLYWPEARGAADGGFFDESEPVTVPFAQRAKRLRDSRLRDCVNRARVIYSNSRCPVCRHPVIDPIELNDGAVGRSNLPVPGTATLVGFRCERCASEWPA